MEGAPFDDGSWHDLEPVTREDSLEIGVASVRGHRVAAAVFRFENHAGTIGIGEAECFVRLVRHAIAERLPLLALVRSGGIRMQEGAEPFTRLVAVARSLSDLRRAGLPFVAHLGHPTTGGALVAIASLAQLRWAEPGALVTVVGPRAGGADLRSERLFELGQLDAVVSQEHLADALGDLLDVLALRGVSGAGGSTEERHVNRLPRSGAPKLVGWEAVRASREPAQQMLRDVVEHASSRTGLSGDRLTADDESVLACICEMGGRACMLVAGSLAADRKLPVPAIRKAARAFEVAGELRLPIVTLVDVAGPDFLTDEEWATLPGAVAHCVEALHRAAVPSVGVMVGSGSGAAALALVGTRSVIAGEGSWLAPLSPEQAASILHRDAAEAPVAADRQRLSSTELHSAGWVDEVVADDPGAVVDAIVRRLEA